MHWQTHTVFNQPTPLNNSNLFLSDTALREAVVREGAGWDGDLLASIGQQLGTAESLELGRLANSNPPELLRYDATGARLDDVRFHPAWHLLQHALPAPFRDWLSPLLSDRYDPHLAPGGQKRGLLIGMGMTEKQGGSDVLSNTTRAEKTAEGFYRLVGHKWFFSVPQSDAHLVLAQAPAGLSCFFVPRLLPDGQRNGVRLERLKEKLGNRSNASSEVEFYEACGWLVGDEGDGVRQILRMGGLTRFDCALGSHALMRRAFSVALYHALQRQAFGKNLVEQPMMRQLLGQMALRLEGQTAFLFRLARAWDRRDDARESAWARLFTPAAKFAICKAGIPFVAEAMEVLGGIGYCEESELPRLYREMPVNSIWEGSGNIMCLDVMRVLSKQPAAMELLAAECAEVKGQNRHLDRAWRQLQQLLKRPAEEQGREIARLVYRLGAGAQMLRHASPPLAEAWCRMMLDTRGGIRLDAPTLDDLLLRAMGRGRQAPQA
ncbi:isovaleryl-CoA dehydrogenase [Klebsiella pneumoniae]|uniref:isovaleryl-CoA dehydrogenase n=1 Tax=Klebsiella pneumoniae TaxID=573 RepID=UPI0024470C3E|nr:isovaleryl-CoA dehydrogenase [Klebsiella pneumoniae]EKW7621786.1 isovaleryl-CoA dehydrogenase [Klebsiella pneumoniae]MDH0459153.1 isovaleryl-CoA dehydrogenase [Klebsiella pneumoniae]MDH1888785.1 isovaleryl-CoA dehydrogenase [Klebsiella pneumoniae]